MNAISKKVAMGIFITLALLFPLVSCSLNSLFSSDQTGEVEITLTIPESLSRSALPVGVLEALVPPESEASRFIHPDTRLIEATVSIDGGRKTISSSTNVRTGETRATVTVRRIPMGNHKLTLSLYDAGSPPVLLSRGTTDISVRPKATAQANVTAVPITENTFNAGPYSTDGVTIDATHSGEILVYRVTLTASGSYMLRCYNPDMKAHEPNDVSLYDNLGKKISTSTAGTGTEQGEYASLSSGVSYVVIDTPDLGRAGSLQVSLDADLRLTSSGDTVYVNQILTVFDRTRPFTINLPCGYSGTPVIGFVVAGSGTPTLAFPDEHTVIVDPGSGSLVANSNKGNCVNVTFVDGLLGKPRLTIPFDLPGAPRTFIYCNADRLIPNGSKANAVATLDLAIDAANGLGTSDLPVIALLEREKFSCGQMGFRNSACLLGGCSADGTRGASFSSTPVTCSVRTNGIAVNADYSQISGIDFTIPVSGTVTTSNEYFMSVGGNYTVITNCTFKYSNLNPLALSSASPITYSTIFISAQDVTFDRCSIINPAITLSGATAHEVNALRDLSSTGTNLNISNCLISAGTLNSASAYHHTFCGINMPAMTGGFLVLAGSTVSSGLIGGTLSSAPYMRAIQIAPGTYNYFYTANSLLVAGDLSSPNSAFIYSNGALATSGLQFHNMALSYENGYAAITPSSRIIYLGSGTEIHYPDWSTSAYASNLLTPLANLNLVATTSTAVGFLKPQASSPAALLSGGGDLSVNSVRNDLSVSSLQPQYLLLDRAGTARTGNGATGYTIGAYEVD
jgi:hypothetical protein